MPVETTFRPAEKKDFAALTRLLNTSPRMHRHLDWHPPLDWLGQRPIYLVEDEDGIQAVLGLPPDPPGIAWIRFYACAAGISVDRYWPELLAYCLGEFSPQQFPIVPALGLSDWFSHLLLKSDFQLHQHIVALSREILDPLPDSTPNPQLFIRPMEFEDLAAVTQIDQLAFEPIWQNSRDQIRHSLLQASYATVAELDEEIVAFQITTANMFSAHLARLAVRPDLRGQRIGYSLVIDLIEKYQRERLWQITVNTQDTNSASLALYRRAGFELTGEKYPVYIYPSPF